MQLKKRVIGAVGRIEEYAAAIPPRNTIKANGAELSRVLFWRLFKHAQESGNLVEQGSKQRGQYGTGNGSTSFTIPDRRGVVGRGFDDGAGLDSAPTLGRFQNDENKSHSHGMAGAGNHTHNVAKVMGQAGTSYSAQYAAGIGNTVGGTHQNTSSAAGNHAHSIHAQGASENTVKNVSFMYCIRYQ
jgi:microcystin-dependent protein